MTTSIDINKRTDQYVKLRDHIKELDDAHKAKMKPYRETLDELNLVLLGYLNEIGVSNAKTESGTVYKTEKKSVTIADMTVFWDFVKSSEEWDMIDKKANVTAVGDYLKENNALPPGLNMTTTNVVGVRRA